MGLYRKVEVLDVVMLMIYLSLMVFQLPFVVYFLTKYIYAIRKFKEGRMKFKYKMTGYSLHDFIVVESSKKA